VTSRQSHREFRERTDLTRRYGIAKHCEPRKIWRSVLFAFGRWHTVPLAELTAARKGMQAHWKNSGSVSSLAFPLGVLKHRH
jgi:hypothetical protein